MTSFSPALLVTVQVPVPSSVVVDRERAGRAHPVQRLVRPAVGVHEHRAVGLDQEQPRGAREVGGETARVVDGARGDDEAHPLHAYCRPPGRTRPPGDPDPGGARGTAGCHDGPRPRRRGPWARRAVRGSTDGGDRSMSRDIRRIGVVGLGTMGAGIAEVFAAQRLRRHRRRRQRGGRRARSRARRESTARAVKRGKLTEDERAATWTGSGSPPTSPTSPTATSWSRPSARASSSSAASSSSSTRSSARTPSSRPTPRPCRSPTSPSRPAARRRSSACTSSTRRRC